MQEKEKRKPKIGRRRMSRFCAVQSMYSAELCNHPIEKIIDDFDLNGCAFITDSISISEIDKDFFKKLLETAYKNLPYIDETISRHLSENWTLERIDSVLKCILRLGIAELIFFKEIPSNVIFNEYIEISKGFFENNEVSFMNGLLNEASKSVRN